MIKYYTRLALIASLPLAILTSQNVSASPVEFVYTGTVASTDIPGVADGSTYTIDVFANNGSSSLDNGVWTFAQTDGFTVTDGSYSGTFSTVFNYGGDAFQTNASGNVVVNEFWGTNSNSVNSDNFGRWTGDTVFGGFGLNDSAGYYLNTGGSSPGDGHWTVEPAGTSVPEPASLALLGIGMLGLGMMRRRKV